MAVKKGRVRQAVAMKLAETGAGPSPQDSDTAAGGVPGQTPGSGSGREAGSRLADLDLQVDFFILVVVS